MTRGTTETNVITDTDTRVPERKPTTPSRSPNETIQAVPLNESCLDCLCFASSGCDPDQKCIGKDGACGPYQIDYAYWYEAGYPGYNGADTDFQKCARDKECAETSVKNYLSRYSRDCNNDGMIDCIDYSALHKVRIDLTPIMAVSYCV